MIGCRPLTDDEIVTILPTISLRNQSLVILGIRTGFRISELLSLKVKDIFQNDIIVDRIYMKRCNMKGQVQGRSVALHMEAKQILARYVVQLGPEDRLFPISRVQAWRFLNKTFVRHQIQGKLGTHCMRKTFANRMYHRLDKDLVKTQQALGHKSIGSTVSYLSFTQTEIDKAILS